MKKGAKGKESVSRQSAAEFFSEHQQIAGFDNPAKSLFTTIREFVENSLDASESVSILPNISLSIVEYSEEEHNQRHGIDKGQKKTSGSKDYQLEQANKANDGDDEVLNEKVKGPEKRKGEQKSKEQKYYLVTCKDNGCGISPDNVGEMLGRVLSGSKHGIRQTRGKYGLGAKMALIWSKKSSGLPITIRTAHSLSADSYPSQITTIVLDIDIYKNEPRIISRKNEANKDNWRGLEISLTILGNWSNSRAKVLQYFQQLAVITPYAHFQLHFQCAKDDKKNFETEFLRRSEQMPPQAMEVKCHPKSLNNITLANLLSETKANNLVKFLSNDLCGVPQPVAAKIVAALGVADVLPSALPSSKIAALLQLLRDEKNIKPPTASSLSPAGEYNIRLGVLKELQPKLVATFTDKPGAHEGHAFLVEAAVSVGGSRMREGINVFRFANRIPLLFETGADVVTQVANKRINWSSYHLDPRKDNVGVYVSIVSTRIPFKGTSKEYIGDDVLDMQQAVRRALQGCCQQLRVSLAQSLARREENERKKTLTKYIPDISRALVSVLKKVCEKEGGQRSFPGAAAGGAGMGLRPTKRSREAMLEEVSRGAMSEESLAAKLTLGVTALEAQCALQAATELSGSLAGGSGGAGASTAKRVCLYLVPTAVSDIPPLQQPDLNQSRKSTGIGGLDSGAIDLVDVDDDDDVEAAMVSRTSTMSSIGGGLGPVSLSQSSVGSNATLTGGSSLAKKSPVDMLDARCSKAVSSGGDASKGRWLRLTCAQAGFVFVASHG